ncbi:MAG: iron export ABC transporter permease subunit FetB [Clostridiales bacterium]|nr:iron export ABC transporter permease subunit FetB [Clostridiales bacterium]
MWRGLFYYIFDIVRGADVVDITTLLMTSILIFIALGISKSQKLHLEKEIIIGIIRAIVQLSFIGIVLTYIFEIDSKVVTTVILLLMVYNASRVAAKKSMSVEGLSLIAFISALAGAFVTIAVLVIIGAIEYMPSQVIPVSGMVVGNAMVALGLTFKQLHENYSSNSCEIEIKLALGATERMASIRLIRDSIRTGMQPIVDSMQTLGIVQLPGMMTGLILAGQSPVLAIKYQIMVTFMLVSAVAITTTIGAFAAYRKHFTEEKQLKRI